MIMMIIVKINIIIFIIITIYIIFSMYLSYFHFQVCLGFVKNYDSNGKEQEVTNEYILSGDYEVDVAGIRFQAKCHLHSPNLPTKFPDKERDSYHATRDHQTI